MSAWAKWTAGAAGALVGAAACGIVVIMVWFAVDPSPKYNNWDFATPLLMLLFAAGAAIVGAAAWGFGAVRLAAGEWRALIAMAVVLALSAVLPVVAAASLKGADLWRAHQKAQREKLPATAFPAEGRERARWIAALGRPAPDAGLTLARRVQSCAARLPKPQNADNLMAGNCLALLLTRADKPSGTWYRGDDGGWRWQFEWVNARSRFVISADRALDDIAQSAPVFEVWDSGLLVKRERRGAPSVAVDRTDLRAVESYRHCLLDAAPRLREKGAWDGRWNTLVDALQGDGGCRGLRAVAASRQFDLPQHVELQSEPSDVAPMRVSYRPVPDRNGFDLNVSGTKRAFLLDSSGHWHVTGFVQQAREEDPAPAPCEIDQSQPCDGY